MNEIEILEQEIAMKKEELKKLKEKQKPRFNYDPLYAYFHKYNPEYLVIENLKNNIRCIAKLMTTARLTPQFSRSKKNSVKVDRFQPKMEEISAEKIAVCNDFIKDISPIVGKYMDKFIEMNEVK